MTLSKNIDTVFHLAADVTIRESDTEYQNNFITNSVGTLNMKCMASTPSVNKLVLLHVGCLF